MTTTGNRPAIDLYAHCPRWCDRETWHGEADYLEDGIVEHGHTVGAGRLQGARGYAHGPVMWEVNLSAHEVPEEVPFPQRYVTITVGGDVVAVLETGEARSIAAALVRAADAEDLR